MSALRPANVEWMVGGRWTSPVFGWYFRMSNANGQTVPSQPTTSNGETSGKALDERVVLLDEDALRARAAGP